jgi:hypothetical protein
MHGNMLAHNMIGGSKRHSDVLTMRGRNGHVPKPSAFHRVSRTAGRASFDWRS